MPRFSVTATFSVIADDAEKAKEVMGGMRHSEPLVALTRFIDVTKVPDMPKATDPQYLEGAAAFKRSIADIMKLDGFQAAVNFASSMCNAMTQETQYDYGYNAAAAEWIAEQRRILNGVK